MVLNKTDYEAIDVAIVKKLRAMDMGMGTEYTDEGVRTESNKAVWAKWRLAPTAIELTVQRLAWWQSVVKHKEGNELLLATFFGDL
eukprot:5932810-Alexandrium_andersonii.AAC.1